MKLILHQYLSDLRERGELDAILPDLLSELGFNVLSRPGRGTRQAGVDVAAVGPDDDRDGCRKLFLFVIKPGDLRRSDWDNDTPQSIRPSLNEILDDYIPHRISQQYQDLDIVVCICIGGEIKEDVRSQWAGYVENNSTEKISFHEWNGDKLAGLLLSGVLKRVFHEKDLQTHFQKSVAMIDEPEVAYRFFTLLTQRLLESNGNTSQITRTRQVYICLWVLFVWAREGGNLDAPFRASEYAILRLWNDCRTLLEMENRTKNQEMCLTVLDQTIRLYFIIAEEFLVNKLGAYVDKPFALSAAVKSHSPLDVNLALFEQFGRLSLYGLWLHWFASDQPELDKTKVYLAKRDQVLETTINMINTNPALSSPIRDDYAIEIALFMLLAQLCDSVDAVFGYLEGMACRLDFSIKYRRNYPVPTTDYHELAGHPVDKSDEYFEKYTPGSVLYPLLIAWLDRLDLSDMRDILATCIKENLSHTNQQVWVPDSKTEENIWIGEVNHGVAIGDLPLCGDPLHYAELLQRIITDHAAFNALSTTKNRFWPIMLTACRHFRLPVPPHLWFLEIKNQTTATEVGTTSH